MYSNPFCQFVSNKYMEQLKSRSNCFIGEDKLRNVNPSNLSKNDYKDLTPSTMDAFKKSIKDISSIKNQHLSDFILKYENKLTDDFILKNQYKCISCYTREPCSTGTSLFDSDGYLLDILCDVCIKKIQACKEYATRQNQPTKSANLTSEPSSSIPQSPNKATADVFDRGDGDSTCNFETNSNSEDELHYYWIEVRNSLYQIFLQEGFLLNPVVMKHINPPVFSSYVMPSNEMLKSFVEKLFNANRHKLFLLTVCHVQLFIMEIKIRLLKELMKLKPYFIFPLFYTLFERLLRALQRTNLFLETVETEFLKKNKLHWFNIHLLFFQTFVYMNRFIQKAISSLCDCATDNGLRTYEDKDCKMIGRFVYRSYVILEQSMASFSFYTNTHSNNFAVFFSKFDDFQLLFQFAILLFNCKNYDENIFTRRFFNSDFTVKCLQDMPYLVKDLLIKDALNTNMFQLFLVIHHWNNTEVFDNVMKRLPNVEGSRSSRSIIKTILTESFIEVGYDETTLLKEFFEFIEQDIPQDCCFQDYLAQEIVLSDEENCDEDLSPCSDDCSHCYGPLKYNHHHNDCDCYSDMFYPNEHWLSSTHNYHEMRDRLRQRLTKRKVKQPTNCDIQLDDSTESSGKNQIIDDRNLDDLLNFINGPKNDCDTKKRRKPKKKRLKNEIANHSDNSLGKNDLDESLNKGTFDVETGENMLQVISSTEPLNGQIQHEHEDLKSKRKKTKKHKNKDKNLPHDDDCSEIIGINTTMNGKEKLHFKENIDATESANLKLNGNFDETCKNGGSSYMNDIDNCTSPEYNNNQNEGFLDTENTRSGYNEYITPYEYLNNPIDDANMSLEKILDSNYLYDVFKPKDIDLDSEELDEFEKELEMFKRLCYNSMDNPRCKPKLTINVKEIFACAKEDNSSNH